MMPRLSSGLPPPTDLGFPEKFASWRPEQLRAINTVLYSDTRFVALTMPTGSGKSLTYIATALLQQGVSRALVLTSTKGLQDQLIADFRAMGLMDVRGQQNYPCLALAAGGALDYFRKASRTGRTPGCDEGPCHAGVKCPHQPSRGVVPDCPYYYAVHLARGAQLVVTNYAYWLAAGDAPNGIGKFDCLILDEAHHASEELEGFLAFDVSAIECSMIGTSMMDSPDVAHWKTWATQHVGGLRVRVENGEQFPPQDADGVQYHRKLKLLLAKVERLASLRADDWTLEATDPGHTHFAPLRVQEYAEKHLFRDVPRVILTSATLTPKTLHLLGVPTEDRTAWECPSAFPLERRPIIHVQPQPEVRVTHRMTDAHKLLWRRRIDRLIASRIDRKGIIHTVSYQRMKDLLTHSEFREHFITHESGSTLQAVAEFKRRPAPCILISPSIMTGFDFPHDECRWQIIGKIPLLDTRGPVLAIRTVLDPEYALYMSMQKLVQAVGRGMRAPDDWCETLIVDDSADWFLKRARKFAPRWFTDAVQWTGSIPDPIDPTTFS